MGIIVMHSKEIRGRLMKNLELFYLYGSVGKYTPEKQDNTSLYTITKRENFITDDIQWFGFHARIDQILRW